MGNLQQRCIWVQQNGAGGVARFSSGLKSPCYGAGRGNVRGSAKHKGSVADGAPAVNTGTPMPAAPARPCRQVIR